MTFPTTPAPHVVAHDSVGRVMRIVIYALLPTVLLHVAFFGVGLLVQITLGVATALGYYLVALGVAVLAILVLAALRAFAHNIIGNHEGEDAEQAGGPRGEAK